ncbi:hypothetical protein MT378_01010 [Psychrobacter sp. 16-Bac2893]
MTEESMHKTSFIILYALIFLFLFISFFSKSIFNNYLIIRDSDKRVGYLFYKSLISTFLVLMLLLMFVFYYFGLKHSFLSVLTGSGTLIDNRLSNRYSGIPTVLISFYNFISIFFTCVVGMFLSKFSKKWSLFLIFLVIFFSSFFGGKAPVVNSIILIVLSYYSSKSDLKFNFSIFSKIIGFLLVIFILLFFVIKAQFPDFNNEDISAFIIGRIGIGQIHGAYEQFALQLRDPKYILHTIPFANFFYDYLPFNKDLMLHTWGLHLDDPSQTGVMNSLFIGEALAIGGYWLVIFSPIIVAFNFCFVASFLVLFLKKYLHIPKLDAQKISALVIVNYIGFTADITGLLFFKSFVMIFLFCILFIFIFKFIRVVKVSL